jgi:hypothetical protein
MRKLALMMALVLTAACDDAVGPSPQLVTPPDVTPQIVLSRTGFHVGDLSELKAALAECRTSIIIDKPIDFDEPSDAIDLDKLMANCPSHQLVLQGNGDWASGQFNRLASFPQPLIKAGHSRDWEFRMTGLRFDGWNFDGPALDLGYVQLSRFDDIIVQRFGGPEPFAIGRSAATSATEFRDVQLNWNRYPGIIFNASDVRWRGGALHSNWKGWNSGLIIRGQPHNPPVTTGGPVLVEDLHLEGSKLLIERARAITIRGGYWFMSRADLNNNVGLTLQCNGMFWSEGAGGIYVNGEKFCGN